MAAGGEGGGWTEADEGMKVYAANVGDSVACLFDSDTGELLTLRVRVWDEV